MTSQPDHHSYNHDLSLLDLLHLIGKARLSILTGMGIGLLIALLFLTLAQPYYKATLIVAPANNNGSAQISSLLSDDKFYALRHMLQGTQDSTDFKKFEQILHGQSLAKTLLQNDTIRKGINLERAQSPLGLGLFTQPQPLNPAILAEYLGDTIKIQPVSGTNFRRITYQHPSPDFAAYILQQIHAQADTILRTETNAHASTRIAYLKDAITRTANPEHRRALTTLLLEQERLKMLSSIDQAYAAAIIEPASSGAKPHWPGKTLTLTLLAALGALLGFLRFSLKNPHAFETMRPHEQSEGLEDQPQKPKKFGHWLRSSANDLLHKSGSKNSKEDKSDAAE